VDFVLDVFQRRIQLKVLLHPEPVLLVSCGIWPVDVRLVHHRSGCFVEVCEASGRNRTHHRRAQGGAVLNFGDDDVDARDIGMLLHP